ncbi:cytochrome c3 family protein [candidate division CSSED10-310 bacterium]|uniref:Cytochrome c3 family protein n=1 Tax=candidate division CSSED10-310 bacterium TaxID=2855610 RepID=A0ABV6Z114_UNCC1
MKHICLIALPLLIFSITGMGNTGFGAEVKKETFTIVLGQDSPVRKKNPAVLFNHDLHTTKLSGDCSKCHYSSTSTKKVCLLTRGAEKRTKQLYQQSYHDLCSPCHEQVTVTTPEQPQNCQFCHNEDKLELNRKIKAFFRHGDHKDLMLSQKGCLHCHIREDGKKLRKIIVCAACHEKESRKEATYQRRTHMFCLGCHFEGPDINQLTCGYCHNITPDAIFPKLELVQEK